MPNFSNPKRGVRISWEYLEAAASAPVGRTMLHTFELYHPDSGYHRFVQGPEDITARLETEAAANPGQLVEFLAAPINDERPEMSDAAGAPEISVTLDNVAGLMSAELAKVRGSNIPWVITERIYASDDFSYPHIVPPVRFEVSNTIMQGAALGIRASYGDPSNFQVPKITFKRKNYPGLQR